MAKTKKRILYILQCYHNRGGVEEHTKALEHGLQNDFECAVLFPHEVGDKMFQVHLRESGVTTEVFPGEDSRWPTVPYRLPLMENAVAAALEKFRPDIIHVQHFYNWHLGLLDQLRQSNIPIVLTLHDYYLITPYFTMQHVGEPKECYTSEYSLRVFKKDISAYLQERRKVLINSIAGIDRILVPSRYLAHETQKAFPREYHVLPHGISGFTPKPRQAETGLIRFGYTGSHLPQKGWRELLAAWPDVYAKYPHARLYFFGGGEKPPVEPIDGVSFFGAYNIPDIPDILAKFDIGVIPSVFRETYSYVLSEMQMAGLPVAVSDIGALGERIIDGQGGKKFLPGNIASMQDTLAWFLEHDEWKTWEIPKPKLIAQMLEEYKTLYQTLA